MTKKTPITSSVATQGKTQKKVPEKPFSTRMQRMMVGKPPEDIILDPDNPNLIMERMQGSS